MWVARFGSLESLETNTDRWLDKLWCAITNAKIGGVDKLPRINPMDEQYQDRPNSSGDDLIDDPGPNMDFQVREYPTSDKRAHGFQWRCHR